MSPIPPNKESNKNYESVSNNQDSNTNNTNVLLNEEQNDEFIIVEGEPTNNNHNNNNYYEPISQNQNEINTNEEEENSDFSSDSDSDIDPEEGFELLASSRAVSSSQRNNTNYDRNDQLFEADVFERKNTLEPEEIHLDEAKSQQINNLMSNFKLPDSSVPEWAKLVPEDVWKQNLLDSLNAKKTDLFDSPNIIPSNK